MKKSLIVIAIASALSACGNSDVVFVPFGSSDAEQGINPNIDRAAIINDLPCMVTTRGSLSIAIKQFETSCGLTEYRRCEYVDLGTYQCSNIEPETVEPETVEPETVEPETVEPETVEPETVEPETVEPETVEPESKVEKNEPSRKAPVKPSKTTNPKLRPVPRPTNNDTTQQNTARHDLIMDYDDVSESNAIKYAKLWSHIILNTGGVVWVSGHSDNIAAVLEYISFAYPDINTRDVKVVTTYDPAEINTHTYKIIDQLATIITAKSGDEIDIIIATNAIMPITHTDGIVVPEELYPIGP